MLQTFSSLVAIFGEKKQPMKRFVYVGYMMCDMYLLNITFSAITSVWNISQSKTRAILVLLSQFQLNVLCVYQL